MVDISEGNSTFAFEIFQKLRKDELNVCLCPLSLGVALAMLTNGANGKSRRELMELINLNQLNSQKEINKAFKSVVKSFSDLTGCTVTLANRLYAHAQFFVNPDFKSTLQDYYKSDAIEVDFSKNAEEMINEWVASQTNNLIRDVLASGSLDDRSRLVLVNAVYFKGKWLKKFTKRMSHYFYVRNRCKDQVEMMEIKDKFQYTENAELRCKMLELYYKGKRLAMYVVLPDEIDGVGRLTEVLTAERFESMRSAMVKQEVVVKLPVFKIKFRKNLIDDLKELKLEEVLKEDEADLSGISHLKGLYLSQAVHQAFVSVEETGSEAPLVTASGTRENQCTDECKCFLADHAFIFLIFDMKSGSVMFIGSFDDPSGGASGGGPTYSRGGTDINSLINRMQVFNTSYRKKYGT